MEKEEFIVSILSRMNQIRQRSKKQWYSEENLQESIDGLRMSILNYVEIRPNEQEEISIYLEQVKQLEEEIYC